MSSLNQCILYLHFNQTHTTSNLVSFCIQTKPKMSKLFFLVTVCLTAAQLAVAEDKLDGSVYFAKANETGPISRDVFDQFPMLAWLGKINGKNFYIERTYSIWSVANTGCKVMGMELAEFAYQMELDFVQAATTPADNGAWCGGLNVESNTIFRLGSGGVLPAFDVGFQTRLGLVVSRGNPSACLSTRPASLNTHLNNYVGYYFCQI